MFQSPFDEDTQKEREVLFEDARNILRAHGDIILNPNSEFELSLELDDNATGSSSGMRKVQVPFMRHFVDRNVADLTFSWIAPSNETQWNALDLDGVLTAVETPSILEADMRWKLDEGICFYANTPNMRKYHQSSKPRFSAKREFIQQGGVNEEGAEIRSYESQLLPWYDELVFVWFTTTTTLSGDYDWRNGVLRVTVMLSQEERQRRIEAWRSGRVDPNLPNNAKLSDWKSLGRVMRVEAIFSMPVSSVATFRLERVLGQRDVVGKRGRAL